MRFARKAALAGLSLSLTTGTVWGAEVCARAPDLVALQVAALQQQLMVAALTCDDVSLYNSFVTMYQKDLVTSDEALQAFFDRFGNEEGSPAYHSYKTKMANLYSSRSAADKKLFCANARATFGPAIKAQKMSLTAFAMSQPSRVSEPYTNCGITVPGGAMVTRTPETAPKPPSNLLTAQNAAAAAKGAAAATTAASAAVVASTATAEAAAKPLSAGLSAETPAKAAEQAYSAAAAAAPPKAAEQVASAAPAKAAEQAASAAAAPAVVAAAGAATTTSSHPAGSDEQPATTSSRSPYYTGYGVGYARERERLAQERADQQAKGSAAAGSAAAGANTAPNSSGPVANSNSYQERGVTRSAPSRSASEAYRERLAQQRAARQRAAERPAVRYRDRYEARGYFWPADPYWQYCYTRYGVRMTCAEAAQRFRANQYYYRDPYDAWSYPSR